MRRLHLITVVCLLSWSLASQADDLDLPGLGVKFKSLPAGVSGPRSSEPAAGHEVAIQLGKATLHVYRENNPVPAGSDVASPGYRATLDERFDRRIESKDQGAPTAVGGHGAWTVVDARPAENSPGTAYTCITYVIVDQHLYRLTVDAQGVTRPPEFDALVQALSGISFEPVTQV